MIYCTHVNSVGWREILYVTPVLAASTRIVMGDVELLGLDEKDVIFCLSHVLSNTSPIYKKKSMSKECYWEELAAFFCCFETFVSY
jgi:hypothetical protein